MNWDSTEAYGLVVFLISNNWAGVGGGRGPFEGRIWIILYCLGFRV